MQGKAVDDIINEWNSELEKRSRLFVKQAESLAQWDRRILHNRHTLLELEEQLRKVAAQHLQICGLCSRQSIKWFCRSGRWQR